MGNSHVSPMWIGLQYTAPMENIYFYLLGITCKPHSSRNTKNQPCVNELEIHTSYVNAVFPNTLATYIYHRKAIFPPYVDELATHTLSKKVVWIDMWHTLPILIYLYFRSMWIRLLTHTFSGTLYFHVESHGVILNASFFMCPWNLRNMYISKTIEGKRSKGARVYPPHRGIKSRHN